MDATLLDFWVHTLFVKNEIQSGSPRYRDSDENPYIENASALVRPGRASLVRKFVDTTRTIRATLPSV